MSPSIQPEWLGAIVAFLSRVLWLAPLAIFGLLLFRCFLFSWIPYQLLWKSFAGSLSHRRIQDARLFPGQLGFEIRHTLVSFAWMALFSTGLFWAYLRGYTRVYHRWDDFPL